VRDRMLVLLPPSVDWAESINRRNFCRAHIRCTAPASTNQYRHSLKASAH